MKITLSAARQILENRLKSSLSRDGDSPHIYDEKTIEKPYGWIFFWVTAAYHQTRDFRHARVGAGPFLVLHNGEMIPLGTGVPLEQRIANIETQYNLVPLSEPKPTE